MSQTITLTEATFACYSKVCAPPPAGRGGSSKSGKAHPYWKGKRRGNASNQTEISREFPKKRDKRRERETDDWMESAPSNRALQSAMRSGKGPVISTATSSVNRARLKMEARRSSRVPVGV